MGHKAYVKWTRFPVVPQFESFRKRLYQKIIPACAIKIPITTNAA